jgi:type IV pilus assembly protein PilP
VVKIRNIKDSAGILIRGAEMIAMSLVLATCSRAENFVDLQSFIDEVKARPAAEVEPVPEFVPYEGFIYGAAALRSPFEAPVIIVLAEGAVLAQDVQPNLERTRAFLESQSLSELSMVGMLTREGIFHALVEDGFGEVHRVGVGNFLGRNHGRVQEISADRVKIVEIVPSGNGGWVERPQTLTLQ